LRLALLGLDTPSTVCETTFPKHHGAPSISSFNQKSYKRELRAALLAMHKVLRLGGICAFIIAASKNKSRNIKDCLIQSGTDAGLDVIGSIKESAFSTLGRLRKRGDPGELLVLFRRIG
jgi:hypothetical protein